MLVFIFFPYSLDQQEVFFFVAFLAQKCNDPSLIKIGGPYFVGQSNFHVTFVA